MQLLRNDGSFLQRALALAEADAAFASPNPAVGCVLTSADSEPKVLGEGAHRYERRDHAEIVALQQAAAQGHDVRGATAYVTLEPCAHYGRTGPCANALIVAGVRRCVVATVDPNPLVSGEGLARLQAAGVEVVLAAPESPIAQAARRLNDAFAFAIQHGRPMVTLKAAVSADGKLAPPPAQRAQQAPHWITGPAARAEVQGLRHQADALLCGVGTLLADNPALTDRTGKPRRRPLLRVVLDSHLRTSPQARLLQDSDRSVLFLAAEDVSPGRAAALRAAGAEVGYVPVQAGKLDLKDVLAQLNTRQVRSVLLEAGPALNGGFLQQGLVDRVILYQGPVSLGPTAVPFAQGGPEPAALLARLGSLREATLPHGETTDQRYTGYLHDPWERVNSVS